MEPPQIRGGFLIPIFTLEKRCLVATIKQMFELVDGVSPKLNVISRTVDKVVGKFDRATKAATEMETSA